MQSWAKSRTSVIPSQWFRDLPLSIKGLAVVAIPITALISVAFSFFLVQRENQHAERWVKHSLEVRSQVQIVHTRLEEAETGVLGYLLTRDPEWLTPFVKAQEQLPQILKHLETMVADNRAQSRRVRRISELVSRRFESLRWLPTSVAPGKTGSDPALLASKTALENIRRLVAETRDEEDRLLEERQMHARAVWKRGYLIIAAGLVLAPIGGILALLVFTNGVVRRIRVLAENAQRFARGKPVTPVASGNDEIGRLERSLADAAALLARRERQLVHSRDDLEVRVKERTAELAEANRALTAEVSERTRAQDEVADTNRRLKSIIDASPLAIIRLDLQGTVQGWNPAAEAIFGWTEQEVVGKLLPTVPDDESESFNELLAGSARGEVLTGYETRRRRKDGKLVNIRLWTAPVRNARGEIRGKIGIAADFTEQRLLEQQLVRAQKMEAIGKLAGGVAHDFNNVITIVTGYGQMLLEQVHDNTEMREEAQAILNAADRAAALAGQLLAFSRRQVIQPRVIDLNGLVRDFQRMLARVIGEDVELKTVLRPDLQPVEVDPGQMEQVLMNLVVNARDAMPGGGRITIETDHVELDEHYVRTHTGVTPGHYVLLAVSDTGEGMSADVRAHLFEPFFTTKERGRGTGLGLSTVYGIVKQHNGDIWVYSEPGRGSTFKVYVPRAGVHAAPERPVGEAKPSTGQETVLLVEDEPVVRKLACEVLKARGYSVLEAESGLRALEIGEGFGGRIDLLVTDIVMPKMSGRDLAEALVLLRPGLKVLFVSGYTDRTVVDHGVLEPGSDFLQKPFSPDALARKVRQVLDDHRADGSTAK